MGNASKITFQIHFSDVVSGNTRPCFLVTDPLHYFQAFQHLLCSAIKLGSSFIKVTAEEGVKPLNS